MEHRLVDMTVTEVTDPKEARAAVKRCGERSAVLAEVELHVFRGATLFVLHAPGAADEPLSYNVTRFGRRRKNAWEPYANWYTAYTPVPLRRRGYAGGLARLVQGLARTAGCRRLKALAGTRLGLLLHVSLGDQLWGVTPLDEVVVDTPLVSGVPEYAGRAPPNAVDGAGTVPWTIDMVNTALAGRPMRYDAIETKKGRGQPPPPT